MTDARGAGCPRPASFPDNGYDVAGVMNEIMNYNLKPENVSEAMTETVSVIVDIAGKSTRTLLNGLSLLKLSSEIRTAIAEGNLPVSQGYLFAANLDCPDLMKAVNSEQ